MKDLIYLAGPLFTPGERWLNSRLAATITEHASCGARRPGCRQRHRLGGGVRLREGNPSGRCTLRLPAGRRGRLREPHDQAFADGKAHTGKWAKDAAGLAAGGEKGPRAAVTDCLFFRPQSALPR